MKLAITPCLWRGRQRLLLCRVMLLALCGMHSAWALSVDEARHLLTRTGFGAAPHEIAALLPLSRTQAVDQLLDGLTTREVSPAPAFVHDSASLAYLQRLGDYVPQRMSGQATPLLSTDQATANTHVGMQEMAQLRVWWLDQMISTPSPMTERIALFWQGHFTSKYFDVEAPRLMYEQLQKIRQLGTQNFASLLSAMLRDPAMLIFLDNAINTRHAPNENFARELLELFTLGVGNYHERDIKEFARILAGHSVDFAGTWDYLPRPEEMDTGVKNFLGEVGAWQLEDAERILLKQPRIARYISEKFYQEFVAPDIDVGQVEQLAVVLRNNHYEMRPFLRALFMSDSFWSKAHRGQLVKSPVELLVGFVRTFDAPSPDLELLNTYAALLGQELFEPPTVQGWTGGLNWLSAQTVALRSEMLTQLWAGRPAGIEYFNAHADDLMVRYSADTREQVQGVVRIVVNGNEVYRGVPRWPADASNQGQFRPKPAWDLITLARNKLPKKIHSIELLYDKPEGDFPNLFVNWIQIDGQRLPAYLATVKFDPKQSCSEAQVPRGMLYCTSRMTFDVEQLLMRAGSPAETGNASLFDRAHGPVNSVIESGTVRVPLAMRPAARSIEHLRQPLAMQWQALSRSPSALLTAVSATPPLQTRQASAATNHQTEQRLRSLTLDPAYNLK